MKHRVVIAAILLHSSPALAQAQCQQHEVVLLYKDVRDVELPALDKMSDQDRDKLSIFYEDALQATQDQTYNSVPLMSNEYNIESVRDGDSIRGAIGIYADSVLAFVSASKLDTTSAKLEQSLRALNGTSPTFAEYNDATYRAEVRAALSAAGCPTDLTNQYGLPPYVSTIPEQPPVTEPDLCEVLPWMCD